MDDPDDGCQFFVDTWADEVRRLVPAFRQLRRQHDVDMRDADRGEDWSPTDDDLYAGFRRLWAAQHHLVWAAHQLERWTAKRAVEQGRAAPPRDKLLANLRNALEHADEAEVGPMELTPASKGNRSLRALPGGSLFIGTDGTHRLFGLIDPAELERRALQVVTTADAMMAEAEDWMAEYGWLYREGAEGIDQGDELS